MRFPERADWPVLAGAAVAQAVVRSLLSVTNLPRLRSMLARLRPIARLGLRGTDDRVIWAVEATGRRLHGISTCLVRALVIEMRLASPLRPLALEVGVKRTADGGLQAHAWLLDCGRVLTGGPIDADFVPILSTSSTGRAA